MPNVQLALGPKLMRLCGSFDIVPGKLLIHEDDRGGKQEIKATEDGSE